MVISEKCEVKTITEKYGFETTGVFAKEAINKGEIINICDTDTCDYSGEINNWKTR
jgi:hypothetical protein